eukprot:768046-Hanusia_phi.AAC.1
MPGGKGYCHVEEEEKGGEEERPAYTCPFMIEDALVEGGDKPPSCSDLKRFFCSKYNNKHGAKCTLDPAKIELKVGSKVIPDDSKLRDYVSAGDDVFVKVLESSKISSLNGAKIACNSHLAVEARRQVQRMHLAPTPPTPTGQQARGRSR